MDITERLRELDKKGYQPLTGAIGDEAATEIERLREAIAPFARLVSETSGRIPTERLSLADWHALAKALIPPNVGAPRI